MTHIRPNHERGSASIEFAIVMSAILLGFFALVVYGGRVVQAENDVNSAAHEAARAASMQGSPDGATAAAHSVALANLARSGVACGPTPQVDVDISQFAPGGQVTVTIACHASFADVGSLGVADSVTFTASATEIIDTYRGG